MNRTLGKIKHRLALVGVAALILASTATGCGTSNEDAPSAGTPAAHTPAASATEQAHALEYTVEHLKARLGSAARMPPYYVSADELLPNVRFAVDSGQGESADPEPLVDAAVVGTVSSVTAGLGFADPASGAKGERMGDGIAVDFDSPDALWRTVHLTVVVEEVLGGVPTGIEQVRVGLAIGNTETDEEHIREGLNALGRTVWFLYKGSAVFDYDPSLYSVLEDGRLIAPVASDGSLSFPMLEKSDLSMRALSGTTLAQLRDAADRPARTVAVRFSDQGAWTR